MATLVVLVNEGADVEDLLQKVFLAVAPVASPMRIVVFIARTRLPL